MDNLPSPFRQWPSPLSGNEANGQSDGISRQTSSFLFENPPGNSHEVESLLSSLLHETSEPAWA